MMGTGSAGSIGIEVGEAEGYRFTPIGTWNRRVEGQSGAQLLLRCLADPPEPVLDRDLRATSETTQGTDLFHEDIPADQGIQGLSHVFVGLIED